MKVLAQLVLSGVPVEVGVDVSDSRTLWLKTESNVEPIYFTQAEAELLVAAIRVAQEEAS